MTRRQRVALHEVGGCGALAALIRGQQLKLSGRDGCQLNATAGTTSGSCEDGVRCVDAAEEEVALRCDLETNLETPWQGI